uniref:HSF-type DNA-binding domain-containing protein n=1 Tax=Grammatophora oceanica TaxID=210454 RepID=A0A7S1YDK1_9STRA|mmetsp:Transcript_40567/g.60125  ORF Transcript_40567/g.60125 Transcript_40567/m.60125 type:complete len:456 (+) Transcript_40567:202-1569(+)
MDDHHCLEVLLAPMNCVDDFMLTAVKIEDEELPPIKVEEESSVSQREDEPEEEEEESDDEDDEDDDDLSTNGPLHHPLPPTLGPPMHPPPYPHCYPPPPPYSYYAPPPYAPYPPPPMPIPRPPPPPAYPATTTTTYRDVSGMADPAPDARRNRGGVTEPFPEKLHRMLAWAEHEGMSDVVGFFPHGRAFAIHKPKDFLEKVMTNFFRQTRLTSFQRQLNLYGFKRITQGPDNGGYYHELFLRGRPGLCINMKRTKVKGNNKLTRQQPETEPNFYAMPAVGGSGSPPAPSPPSKAPPPALFPQYPAYSYGPYPPPPPPPQNYYPPPAAPYPPPYPYPSYYPPPPPHHLLVPPPPEPESEAPLPAAPVSDLSSSSSSSDRPETPISGALDDDAASVMMTPTMTTAFLNSSVSVPTTPRTPGTPVLPLDAAGVMDTPNGGDSLKAIVMGSDDEHDQCL